MSEHPKVTFLRPVVLYDDSDKPRKLKKRIAQARPGERFVQRFASVMVLFLVLAILGVGVMVAFAGLLMGYGRRLKRLQNPHQLVTSRQESRPGKPDTTTLPGSHRGSDDRESFQGAAEGSDYHGGLDSPSWLSNRLCG